jgi:hypothetical protein
MVALPLPARAGESPLAQLPGETPVVVSLHGIERTKNRLKALIEKAVPDLAAQVLAHMKEELDKALDGRKLAGLDPDGPVFLALTTLPKGGAPPQGAVIAKVTDYMLFRNSFFTEEERKNLKKDKAGYEITTFKGQEVFLFHRKGYVTVAMEKEVAEQLLSQKGAGLEGKLDKQVAGQLLESDAAVYVDMQAINKEYGEMLQAMRQFIPAMIEQAAENAPGQFDKNTAKLTKAYLEGMFQAIEDARHFLLSARIPPEGLAVHAEVGFKADSASNKVLSQIKTYPLAGVEKLPPGYLAYVAMQQEAKTFKMLEPLIRGVMGSPEGAKEKDLQQALDELLAAGPGLVLMATSPGSKGLQVAHYKDAEKAAAAQLKFFDALRDVTLYASMPLKEKPVVRANAETFRGGKFHFFSVKWDFDKQFANLPAGAQQMADAMKKLAGEGANLWFGALDGALVTVQAKDWKAAEILLQEYVEKKETVGDKFKSFAQTREHLPREATGIALISAPELTELGGQYASVFMQIFGLPAPQLAPAKRSEPFLGVSVTLKNEHAGLDLWIPAEIARDVRRLVEGFTKAAGGQ